MKFTAHQASHIGNRKYNQDRVGYAYCGDALLLVLADGMGGHQRGELAAQLIVDTFVELFAKRANPRLDEPGSFIGDAMRLAHERILQVPYDENAGGFPGSTCVAALIHGNRMYWGHAGDSRLYLLRDGKFAARTRDHSMVAQWVEWGVISDEEARVHPQRNQITNCLGGQSDLFMMEPGEPVDLQSGDVLLLCSDGLWGPYTDDELARALVVGPVEALEALLREALQRERGRSDNVTGLVVRWGEGEETHEVAEPVYHVLDIE